MQRGFRLGLLSAAAFALLAAGCGGGGGGNHDDTSRDFQKYGAIGALGLPGLTSDIASGNGRVYEAYEIPASGLNIVFVDNDSRTGNTNTPDINTTAIGRIDYPTGAPGEYPVSRQPFALALTANKALYVGVLSKSHPAVPNTVEKFDATPASPTRIASWDPLAANAGLSFNFTPPVGQPLVPDPNDSENVIANAAFVPPQMSLAVDPAGNLYVVDAISPGSSTYRIRKFRGTDAVLDTTFGSGGSITIGGFGKAAVDGDGTVYIAYTNTSLAPGTAGRAGVKKFAANGTEDTAFENAVASLQLADTTEYDRVNDVEVVGDGGTRRVYVLEYRRTGGLKQSFVHGLDTSGTEHTDVELTNGLSGIDARDLAVDNDRNFRADVAYGTYYATSGGWGFFKHQ